MSEPKTYTVRRGVELRDVGDRGVAANVTLTAVSTATDSLYQPTLRVQVTAHGIADKPFTATEEISVKATDLLHAALAAQDDLWVLAEDGAQS